MLFRVIGNKLYQIKIKISNEDEFIKNNETFSFIKVNPADLPKTDIETDEVFYELINGNITIDLERTQERAIEYFKERQGKVLKRLLKLCDDKTNDVLSALSEQPVTQAQLERYKQKESMARAYIANGSYANELQIEASLIGMTVDEFANLIISASDEFNRKANYFISLIEAFRVKVKNLILNATSISDLDYANKVIDKAVNLGASATQDDIQSLFASQ